MNLCMMFMKPNVISYAFLNYSWNNGNSRGTHQMDVIIKILVMWTVISIPSSMVIGSLLARRSAAQRSEIVSYVHALETSEFPAV